MIQTLGFPYVTISKKDSGLLCSKGNLGLLSGVLGGQGRFFSRIKKEKFLRLGEKNKHRVGNRKFSGGTRGGETDKDR